ncbi:hypothetical protein BV378_31585 [Nostoc sp. RF31YmG]|nr:hypothetical protein BV378_31585 [Nostoc sp. RF31YmG]
MTAEVKASIPQEIAQVLAKIGSAFFMLNNQWRYTYVNDKAAELAGINQESFLGKTIWELFPETVNSQLQAELYRAVTEQVAVDFEYFFPISHRWWENHIYPSENGVAMFITDITQRKRSQQYQAAQYAITNILAEATTVANALPKVLQSLCENLGWQAGIFWSVDLQINALRCINTWQSSSLKIEDCRAFYQQTNSEIGQGLPNRVWASGQAVWEQREGSREDSELQAAIGFPIELGSEILGVIECFSQRILEPDTEFLKAIASQIGQFIERKRMESLLRQSEARYRSLAESSAAIIWTAAPWGNVVEEIPTWEVFTGQTPAQYKGWGWVDAIHPEDRQSIVAIWKAIYATRSVAVAEYRVRRHDGEYRHMSIRSVPILDETGEIQEWVGMCVDITEHKQAEAEREILLRQLETERTRLLETNTLLDTLFNNAPIGIGIWDEKLRYVRLNDALAEINGLPQEAHIGKTVAEVLPEIGAEVMAAFRHVVETGESIVAQEASGETPAAPGKLRYWSVNYYPIALPNKITWVGATCEEITERKQEEERQIFLAEASGILASSLDYETTLASLAQLIVPEIADWCVVDIVDENQSVHRVATAHADPTKQQLVEQLKNYPPDLARTEGVAEVIRSGKPQITHFIPGQKMQAVSQNDSHLQLLQELKPKSGMCVPLIVGGRVLGAITLVSTSGRDYDDRNLILTEELARRAATAVDNARLYTAEQTAREAAETANRIKDEFLAVLSHELRSPLNPILGWSNLLQTQNLDDQTSAYALKTIERNARLQAELIEDLLDISRILQGKLSLNISPVDLVSVITAAMETVRLSAEAKSIAIHTMRDPEVGQVLGDSSRLQQIIWNLLSNAVKFTPEGGRVDIHLEQIGTQAQITISDTGKGISSDFLPYVFDYFRQENSTSTRKFGGLGLGLAIVRHLVELHGGTVQAQSQGEGQGATFIVKLPLMQQRLQVNNDTTEPQPALDLSGVQILLVDDDTDTRDFLSFFLEEYGANVTATASAAEALAALTQSQPDILLSDIGMPEVDGWMLINQVRMLPPEQGGQIPVIAITAYAGQINAQQALSAGFNKHLAKPVEPTELLEMIINLLV